jgi:hypothetical protein
MRYASEGGVITHLMIRAMKLMGDFIGLILGVICIEAQLIWSIELYSYHEGGSFLCLKDSAFTKRDM